MQFAHTHLPPFSSLGADRSGQPKILSRQTLARESSSPHSLLEPRDLLLFICVVQEILEIPKGSQMMHHSHTCFSHSSFTNPIGLPSSTHLFGVSNADLFQSSDASCILTVAHLSKPTTENPALCEMDRDLSP